MRKGGWALSAVTMIGTAALTACGPPPVSVSAPAGDDTRTVTSTTAAGERTTVVHHPAGAGPGAPLLVVLHGAGGTGAQVRDSLGWDAVADRDGAVVAYPDGLGGTWNAGSCCGAAVDRDVDDVGFLHDLTVRLAADDGIDPRRVSAVGFSNGAMLAYAWACARPGDLAGVGAVAGAVVVDCPAPGPVTVVAVHGTDDDRVPFAGGPGPRNRTFPSLDGSLAPFLRADGCAARPVTGAPLVSAWSCADGRSVVRGVIDGGGHAWPGAGPGAGTGSGPSDATAFLWEYLR